MDVEDNEFPMNYSSVFEICGSDTGESEEEMLSALADQDYIYRPRISSRSWFELGNYLWNLHGSHSNLSRAVEFFTFAALDGLPQAQIKLATIWQEGRAGLHSALLAAYWFGCAAEQGVPEGLFKLSLCYRDGEGVPRDKQRFLFYLNRAAQAGSIDATRMIRRQHSEDVFRAHFHKFPPDSQKLPAEHEWMLLAEWGDPNGLVMWASWLQEHEDNDEASVWWQKAARAGSAEAQYKMACAYLQGSHVEKNSDEAAYWCRLAAEQGHKSAQLLFSILLKNGEGVCQNEELSELWNRRSRQYVF